MLRKTIMLPVVGGLLAASTIAAAPAFAKAPIEYQYGINVYGANVLDFVAGENAQIDGSRGVVGSGPSPGPLTVRYCLHDTQPGSCDVYPTTATGRYAGWSVTVKVRGKAGDKAFLVVDVEGSSSETVVYKPAHLEQEVVVKAHGLFENLEFPRSVAKDAEFSITGKARQRNSDGGTSPVPSAELVLWGSSDLTSWASQGQTKADPDGSFKFTRRMSDASYYRIAFRGAVVGGPSEQFKIDLAQPQPTPSPVPPTPSPTPSPVAPKPSPTPSPVPPKPSPEQPKPTPRKSATKVKADAGPEPVKRGKKLTVRGSLVELLQGKTKSVAHAKVAVYFHPKGSGKWKFVGWVRTDAHGNFKLMPKAWRDGSWRVKFTGDDHRTGSASAPDYVDVK